LKTLADPTQMLSNAGLRSLGKKDQFYLYRSNYWRGAVWINVNFLVLRGLYNYYSDYGSMSNPIIMDPNGNGKDLINGKDLYQTIRSRIIETVYKNWIKDHLFFEQYDNES
jgi:mannosyl-oligosaccharide glucosidase